MTVTFTDGEAYPGTVDAVNDRGLPHCPSRWLHTIKYDDGDTNPCNTDNVAFKDLMHTGADIEEKANPGWAAGILQAIRRSGGTRRWFMHYPSESVQKSAGYFHDLKEANYGVPAVSEPHRCWVLLKTLRPDPTED